MMEAIESKGGRKIEDTANIEEFARFVPFFNAFGIIVIVTALVGAIKMTSLVTKSEINVYENEVRGVGVSTNLLGSHKAHNFVFTYEQILSMDITKESEITINAIGIKLKCYVLNPYEIREAIMHQQNKHR